MNSYLLAGFIIGAALIAIHIAVGIMRKQGPRLEGAVVLMISALSIATGVKVIKICITASSLKPFADEDRVYIALGGLALIWVSVGTILAIMKPDSQDPIDPSP